MTTPAPEKLFPWGTQTRRLYDALATEGEVTNQRITRRLRVRFYSAVIEQIREAVRPFGLDVVRRDLSSGVRTYRLAIVEQKKAA